MLLCMGVKHGHTSKEMQLEEMKGKRYIVVCSVISVLLV
jgi:hypothetical protein